MKLPTGGKMKKFFAEVTHTMYACYLAGRKHEKDGMEELGLSEFAKDAKLIHAEGKKLWKESVIENARDVQGAAQEESD